MLCISRGTVIVIGSVREVVRVVSEYLGVVRSDVVGGAVGDIGGAAPRLSYWVDDHLRVSSDIGPHITVAGCAVVFPAAPYVHQVELALRTSPFLDVQTQLHLKIRRLRQLQQSQGSKSMHVPT